ncbi:hypothetical protein [Rubripirellula obstinata]|nr:hypothetical protein [Rubripirellula obstinata]
MIDHIRVIDLFFFSISSIPKGTLGERSRKRPHFRLLLYEKAA